MIVPVVTLLMGFAMPEAIGTSLLVVAINSAIALLARLEGAHIDLGAAHLLRRAGPGLAREGARAGADLIVTLSNDSGSPTDPARVST